MLCLSTVTREDFARALQQDFEVITGTGGITLHLAAAEALPHGHPGRPHPFVLRFTGSPELRLPQSIYRLQNVTLGPMELFLTQVGADQQASHFEAIFN